MLVSRYVIRVRRGSERANRCSRVPLDAFPLSAISRALASVYVKCVQRDGVEEIKKN
jgi:hypothetical protein